MLAYPSPLGSPPGALDVEMMDHDPTTTSVSETPHSPYYAKAVTSPGEYSNVGSPQTFQRGRKRYNKPAFNRNTVKIEEYLWKNAADINAKAMRVLLPSMYQKFRHPDKETGKTKVKGLWEACNKPDDFPDDIEFKDPNNAIGTSSAKKMGNEMMKRFFNYLKAKLLQMPEYQQRVRRRSECYNTESVAVVPAMTTTATTPAVHTSQRPDNIQPYAEIPNLDMFDGSTSHQHNQQYGYSSQTQSIDRHVHTSSCLSTCIYQMQPPKSTWIDHGKGYSILEKMDEDLSSGVSIIPATVDQVKDEDADAAMVLSRLGCMPVRSNDEGPGQLLVQYGPADSSSFGQPDMTYPQPRAAIPVPCQTYISQDMDGNTVTDLTVLHKVPVLETPSSCQTITLVEEEYSRQPVHPQDVPHTTSTSPDSTQDSECAKFVQAIRESLLPALKEFGDTFKDDENVIILVQGILDDVLKPKFDVATQGDKAECQQVSKFCSKFQEILKRYCFLGKDSTPFPELKDLKGEYVASNMLVIPECQVPDVDHEEQVYRVELEDVKPVFTNPQEPWIPTVTELETRARNKQQELGEMDIKLDFPIYSCPEKAFMYNEKNCNCEGKVCSCDQKVKVEKVPYYESLLSPMCADLNDMNLDADRILTEEDLGISVVEHWDQDPNDDILRAIDEQLKKKEAKEARDQSRYQMTEQQIQNTLPTETLQTHLFPQQMAAPVQHDNSLLTWGTYSTNEDQAVQNMLSDAYKHFGNGSMTVDNPPVYNGFLGMSGSTFSQMLEDLKQPDTNNAISIPDEPMFVEDDYIVDSQMNVGVQPEVLQPARTKFMQPTQATRQLQVNRATPASLPTVLEQWKGLHTVADNIPITVFEAAERSDDDAPKSKRRASAKSRGPRRASVKQRK